MRKVFFLICLSGSLRAASQDFRDTVFTVRGETCSCKYNMNPEDDNRIFDHEAAPARYPGGEDAWTKYVKKNLDKGWKGKDKVEVRFQVDRNGDISSFVLMNKAPNQKYAEVLRVIRESGKWFPSVQKGFCVKSFVWLSFEL